MAKSRFYSHSLSSFFFLCFGSLNDIVRNRYREFPVNLSRSRTRRKRFPKRELSASESDNWRGKKKKNKAARIVGGGAEERRRLAHFNNRKSEKAEAAYGL